MEAVSAVMANGGIWAGSLMHGVPESGGHARRKLNCSGQGLMNLGVQDSPGVSFRGVRGVRAAQRSVNDVD